MSLTDSHTRWNGGGTDPPEGRVQGRGKWREWRGYVGVRNTDTHGGTFSPTDFDRLYIFLYRFVVRIRRPVHMCEGGA
jgi:hypothetical protein